jgi:regulator of protease activity HflC (stomatin/prohibitin superfamily)
LNNSERTIKTLPGLPMLFAVIAAFVGGIYMIINGIGASEAGDNGGPLVAMAAGLLLAASIATSGFFIVEPNGSKVLLLFGKYKGTVKDDGFYWANPFMTKRGLSRRVRTLDAEKLKVNDLKGNPIEIAAIVVYQVVDTYAASFQVEDYERHVTLQSETALRHLAGSYPYDDSDEMPSLRQNADKIGDHLQAELQERCRLAGVNIVEARLAHLAYAPEIAGAMLRRQQADAVISAREKIVDGAVSMVEMALKRLEEEGVINLDEERKAAMVSNLMVVLCSDHAATPVLNTGTLHN